MDGVTCGIDLRPLTLLTSDPLKVFPAARLTIYIEMNNAQANLYEQRRVYYKNQVEQSIAADGIQKSQFVIFQALNELRQIASYSRKAIKR